MLEAKKRKLGNNIEQVRKLEEVRSKILSQLQQNESDRSQLISQMEFIKDRITSLNEYISSLNQELSRKEAEINELMKKLTESSRVSELYEKHKSLVDKRGRISGEISQIEQEIKEISSITVFNTQMPVSNAIQLCEKFISTLKEVSNYIVKRIDEQRTGFAKKFNEAVDAVVKGLGFGLKVIIEPVELKILIERSGTYQPITSLSSSEKFAIAIVLQMALREAFTPEIPFFLVDEVIMAFDAERAHKIAEYLFETAVNQNLFVVLAKVGKQSIVRQITSKEQLKALF